MTISDNTLSEQHPREQGLKHAKIDAAIIWGQLSEQHPREQGLKQSYDVIEDISIDPFRATSKRTRIETLTLESLIQKHHPFRATSKRTRIETP